MIDWALTGFVFFGLMSPGPNVILVTISGASFGFRRTIPHILGIAVGVGLIAFLTGLGIGGLLKTSPNSAFLLKIAAASWIAWMAWKLWQSDIANRQTLVRPFNLIQAILFQWVNPKIWAVALASLAFVVEQPPVIQAVTLGLTFSILNLGVCSFWTLAGKSLEPLLVRSSHWRIFVRLLAASLLVFSVLVFI